jgi:hypothetical protein
VLRDLDQPGLRIFGNAFDRPLLVRSNEGFVQQVLGNVEVADGAHDRREHPAEVLFVKGAEVLFERRWCKWAHETGVI